MGDPAPRYKTIEDFLLKRIGDGTYAVHQQIPPEEQLARDFGVSRMTANRAIRELVQKGYLVRHAGQGTFVIDHKAESSASEVLNIAREVERRGHRYSNELIRCEAVRADDAVALHLGMLQGTSVFHTVMVHLEDGMAIQLEDRFVNPRWVPDYLQADFSLKTPNEVLVAACAISDVEHVIEAVAADARTAELLRMQVGQPCLSVNRRTWSDEGLVSYARLLHPGDRYKLRSHHTSR